jgi:hypothetical protein
VSAPGSHVYRRLDAAHLDATARRLANRVAERFPGSGLAALAQDLVALGAESAGLAAALARPHLALRAAAGAGVALLLALLAFAAAQIDWRLEAGDATQLLQGIESAVNDAVFVAIAVWFLLGWERRVKRRRALRALHALRSMTHIIDMHQLTKDPERLLAAGADTSSSPPRSLSAFELGRYLDYCSEMLSVLGKHAALFAQDFDDPPTLAAVNEIESLGAELSQKIGQKMAMLEHVARSAG